MARLTVATLSAENRQLAGNLELLQERLAELELALENEGWTRLGFESERELSRDGLRKIIALSRLMYLKSPVINRGVNVHAMYVWGQGVNIEATDPDVNEVIQAFLDDPKNQAELTSHQARELKEVDLQVLGNLFFVFFVDRATGAVRVRTIPVDEVGEIVCNPEDRKDPWFYRRTWSQTSLDGQLTARTAYYPDWRYSGPDRPRDIGGVPVLWDTPVYHVKVGGLSDMRFGVPETYQSLDWARAYKEFLEDRATIARALSRFAWRLTTPGGAKGVAAAKAKLATTQTPFTAETNPAPTVGAAFVGAPGAALDPIRTSGATINPEEGRRFLLMAAMGQGLPETFYGDVSTGNLATAKSLDRPTELKFRDRQQLWADVLHDILQFVVEQAIAAPGGRLAAGVDRHIDVSFPDILERDTEARIRAIVSAATLDGKAPAGTLDDRTLVKLLLQALGLDDIDELLDTIVPEGDESLAQRRQQNQPAAEAFSEALRELRLAVERVVAS